MITVTERAADALEELLTVNHAPPGHGVKLVPGDAGSVRLTIAAPSDGDEVVSRGDDPLLIVDRQIVVPLDGSRIDCETAVVDGQPQPEFRLEPPER